jgi:hypothetical protein
MLHPHVTNEPATPMCPLAACHQRITCGTRKKISNLILQTSVESVNLDMPMGMVIINISFHTQQAEEIIFPKKKGEIIFKELESWSCAVIVMFLSTTPSKLVKKKLLLAST